MTAADRQTSSASAEAVVAEPWPPLQPASTALAVAIALAAAAGLGWLDSIIERYFSPLIIFPLLQGLILGGIVAGAILWLHVTWKSIGRALAVAAAIVLVGSYHWSCYQSYRQAVVAQAGEGFGALAAQQMLPNTFVDYMLYEANERGRLITLQTFRQRLVGWQVWALWTFELLLIGGVAWCVVNVAMSGPICLESGCWYRSVRRGVLPVLLAQEAQHDFGIPSVPETEYRLLVCPRGIGPMALELTWDKSPEHPAGRKVELLHGELRNRWLNFLDSR